MASGTIKHKKRAPVPSVPKPSQIGWIERLVPVVLVLLTLFCFWRVCGCDFTSWDDYDNVAKNPLLNPPTVDGVLYFWGNAYIAMYIPLTYTIWALVAGIARLPSPDASGIWLNSYLFHTANLVVHVSAVLLAYALLKRLTRNSLAAGAASLLFAFHPVQVESVAWVTGMKDVLCGALSLAALWQYTLFAQPARPDEPQRSDRARRLNYIWATTAFVLAMLAKPSAMMVPLAALVLDGILFRRSWAKMAWTLAPWMVLSLACAWWARHVQPVAAPPDGGRVLMRPLLAGAALAFYLYKLAWPAVLSVQYHYAPQVLLGTRWIWIAWLIPIALIVGAWLLRRRAPWALAGVLLFIVPVVPVLGLVPFQFERLSLTADHYLYLAMIGPAVVVACALASIRRGRGIWVGVVVALCVVLGIRSYFQTLHWQDTQTLFAHALTANPHSEVAAEQLANVALADHQPQEAQRYARLAIRLQPDYAEAYATLGSSLYADQRKDEGLAAFQRAYELNRDDPRVLSSLAGALADHGKMELAIPLCRRAVELDPLSAAAHRNLAVMLSSQKQIPEALQEAQTAVRLDPDNAEGQANLGVLLFVTGQRNQAVEHLQQALRLDPNSAKAAGALRAMTRQQ